MYYPDQPFHIRTYKKSELAHLYNPNVCLKVALQILRRWIVYNPPLLQELEQEGYRARNRLLSPPASGNDHTLFGRTLGT